MNRCSWPLLCADKIAGRPARSNDRGLASNAERLDRRGTVFVKLQTKSAMPDQDEPLEIDYGSSSDVDRIKYGYDRSGSG